MEPKSESPSAIEEITAKQRAVVGPLLGAEETLLAAASSDILCDGSFGEEHLAVSSERVIVVRGDGGAGQFAASLPLKQISSFRYLELHGVTRLDAHTAERAVPLAMFTHMERTRYERAVEAAKPHISAAEEWEEAAAGSEGDEPQHEWRGREHGHEHGGRHGHGQWHGQGQEARICESCGKPIPHRLGVCPDCLDRKRLLVRMLMHVKPYLLPMSAGLLFMLVITAVEMTQPLLTKILVDDVIPNSNLRLFAWVVLAIIGIHTFTALFSGIRTFLMGWLGERIVHDLRKEVYRHIQTLSLDFYDQRQTGWIMDRVSADTSNLQRFLSEGFQDFIRDAMTVVVIVAIMFAMNWKLTLVTLVPTPLVVWLTIRFMRTTRRLFHTAWRRRAWMTAVLANVIPGVRVVKAFAQENREAQRFFQRSLDYMNAHVRLARTFSTFSPVTRFVTALGSVFVWGIGGYWVITGQSVTLGTLLAFIAYLWRFYGPVNQLSRFSQTFQRATTSAQRVFDVLDAQPTVKDPVDQTAMGRISGRVEFKNVSFGYELDEPVLKEVSFAVEPGEMVGLVGPSGAGKSTTINLLCRFYDVNGGTIEIDGVDIRTVTLESLHSQIGVVLQEPFLFHGTIAENIAYGKPDATAEEILRSAKAANAHDFVMQFPDGYDTLVGERGQRLSGGERQRISIARAVLKDPRILILDEATSSVDTETEATIQEAIRRLVRGRTTFAIAHRFSTLRCADRLVVLEEGRVVEVGSHQELLAKEDGLFKHLCEIQNQNNQIVAVGG